ncbi:hypothetical protein P8452_71550 [Trifolium repens]|nr:hypothetical protein P8452_71550 [Trifolium repens]
MKKKNVKIVTVGPDVIESSADRLRADQKEQHQTRIKHAGARYSSRTAQIPSPGPPQEQAKHEGRRD